MILQVLNVRAPQQNVVHVLVNLPPHVKFNLSVGNDVEQVGRATHILSKGGEAVCAVYSDHYEKVPALL